MKFIFFKYSKMRIKYGEYKPPIFELSEKKTWLKFLQDEGYVVIQDIIDDETNSKATNIFKKEWCQVTPNFKIWPAPENSTDILIFDRLYRIDDVDDFTNTLGVPFRFYPALAAGLAYYIALKRAPNRIQVLKPLYEEEMERAMVEDRDRASFNVVPSLEYARFN